MRQSILSRAVIGEMTRFGTVGLVNTALTLAIIYALHSLLGMTYLLANGIGFLAGFINSFFMNRSWTFNSKGNLLRESVWFILVFFISYLVQLVTLIGFKDYMGWSTVTAQILAMGAYTLTNFLGNRMLTFTNRP